MLDEFSISKATFYVANTNLTLNEEQRRKQKEAAQRRARGDKKDGHRHPLNSERRRANRRKPKWKKDLKATNEHNASGSVLN